MSEKDGYTKLLVEIPDELLRNFEVASVNEGKTVEQAIEKSMVKFVSTYGISNLPEESRSWKLRQRVVEFSDLFYDMTFDEDSITAQFLDGGSARDRRFLIPGLLCEVDYDGYAFCIEKVGDGKGPRAWYDAYNHSLHIREDALDDDYVLLHEMIHFYERRFDRFPKYFRDMVLVSLYTDLSPKVLEMGEELNALILKALNALNANAIDVTGGDHSILFYLKSLDLDIKMGYPLGTVFTYQAIIG